MRLFKHYAQCLKITQKIAVEFLNFGIFTNFWHIKTDLSGNIAWSQASGFKIHFGTFNELLCTSIVNVARFARNVEWDFFCDFQTWWFCPPTRQTIFCCLNILASFHELATQFWWCFTNAYYYFSYYWTATLCYCSKYTAFWEQKIPMCAWTKITCLQSSADLKFKPFLKMHLWDSRLCK